MAGEVAQEPPVFPVDMSVRHVHCYALDQCDVRPGKRDALTLYREKRQAWVHLLDGDPEHSIHLQIGGMMWADAAYRAMNEARRFSTEQNPTAAIAPMLAELLDHGYVASMILAIGKLTDAQQRKADRGVISLRAILGDIRQNRDLLTRELYVCHGGLPYDPDASEERYYRRNPPVPGQPRWVPTDGPDAFRVAERAHASFDALAGVSKSARKPDDMIRNEVFDNLDALLNCPDIKHCNGLRNKFVAHAATATSRATANVAGFEITLDQIASAQRSLIVANHKIRRDILWDGAGNPVPTPQFDQFSHLDRTFVQTENVHELHRWWNRHAADRAAWLT